MDVRGFVLNGVIEKLLEKGIEVVVASLDDHHLHLLARFPDHNPRHWLGMAKKNAAHLLRDGEGEGTGGIWAKRSKCEPVKHRKHQVNVVKYIIAHGKRGAAVWVSPVIRERAQKRKAHG